MAIRFNTAKRNVLAQAGVQDLTHADIYTGGQPASANTAASGTLLGTVSGLTWQQGSAGVWQRSGSAPGVAGASGTAGWVRFRNVLDTLRMDALVGSEVTVSPTASILSGGNVDVTAATLTQPSGE